MSRNLAVVLAAAAITLPFAMWSRLVDRMIFQPTPGMQVSPEELGIEAEPIFLDTEDGVRIHAFFLPAGPTPGEAPASATNRALLFLHGNAGNASHRLPNAAALARLGVAVLLLDYRGYGLSEGRPSEPGAYADARAGLRHLVEDRRVPERRVVLFGRSLGGAVAVDLAAGRDLGGVILESTFTSAGDVARSVFGAPFAALAGSRFDSASKIAAVRAPLLFFHGDRDDIVDARLGRRLYELAPEPKAFEPLVGAGHNDTFEVGGRAYLERIGRFLDEVARR